MKKMYMRSCVWLLVLSLMAPIGGYAQDSESAPPVFRQEELDQMLAPIALYPDSLLIQVLIAATYPLEVVQAARWVSSNPNVKDEKMVIALEEKAWDPSVKSLVNFPDVLAMMNERLEWTQNLGDAFLGQKEQVMATVQNLRAKAQAQGTLKTTDEQVVVVEEESIVIEPANPQVVYVPAYNPTVVFGPWWYPAYPPYYFHPPGYVVARAGVITFGVGVGLGVAWGYAWGGVHWANHRVFINPAQNIRINPHYYNHARHKNIHISGQGPSPWRHDPIHRKGVAYRDPGVHQQFGRGGNSGADARKDFRGFDQGGRKAGEGTGQDQRRYDGIPNTRQPGERKKDAAGGEGVKHDRQALDQRRDATIKDNAEGSRRSMDKSKGAVQGGSATMPQNRSSGPIENLNRGGNEVKQQSERGRISRESTPAQKPSQTFQGGKVNQGVGGAIPNSGVTNRGAGGAGTVPNTGVSNRGAGGAGTVPNTGVSNRGAGGAGTVPNTGAINRGPGGAGTIPNTGADGAHGGGRRQ